MPDAFINICVNHEIKEWTRLNYFVRNEVKAVYKSRLAWLLQVAKRCNSATEEIQGEQKFVDLAFIVAFLLRNIQRHQYFHFRKSKRVHLNDKQGYPFARKFWAAPVMVF